MKIVIDPGHGGKDPGAVGNGLKEKDLTLIISQKVASILGSYGFNIILTRNDDRFVDLAAPRVLACDLSVSIHVNAGGGTGLETWVALYNQPAESKRLGQAIQDGVLGQIPFTDRGLKTRKNSAGNADYLYMLRAARGVPVLVEVGFIDNAKDAAMLKDNNNLDKIAKGIADGILQYAGKGSKDITIKEAPAVWAREAWEWAKREGYLDGTRPKDAVTREELAAVLNRVTGKLGGK